MDKKKKSYSEEDLLCGIKTPTVKFNFKVTRQDYAYFTATLLGRASIPCLCACHLDASNHRKLLVNRKEENLSGRKWFSC